VRVRRTDRFRRDYRKLPQTIQERVDQKLRFLLRDPRHPSLRIHKIRGVEGLWELSVMRNELPGDLRNQHGSLRTTRRGISQHPGRDLKLLRACLRGVKSAIRFTSRVSAQSHSMQVPRS
jgi:hypothetical protein